MQIYLVGGAVRDRLLGRPARERDWVVVGAEPRALIERGFRRKDPDFPVFLHPDSGEEYALARRERKRGTGHKGFVVEFGPDVRLEEDLARRDLTVNAMADDAAGNLIDPHGGQRDLAARLLRHVTEAFEEDPLRVLRLARFDAELAPWGFRIDPATETLARRMSAAPELEHLTPGRIWRETARALASEHPARYFRALHRFGALARLAPALAVDDALDALDRAAAASGDSAVRLAALATAAGAQPPASWPVPAASFALLRLCLEHPPETGDDAEAVVAWLEAIDAWRRRERFEAALAVWAAVRPGSDHALANLERAREASARPGAPPAGADPRQWVREQRTRLVREALRAGARDRTGTP